MRLATFLFLIALNSNIVTKEVKVYIKKINIFTLFAKAHLAVLHHLPKSKVIAFSSKAKN